MTTRPAVRINRLMLMAFIVGMGLAGSYHIVHRRWVSWHITEAVQLSIDRGMTVGEVAKLIGGPPGNYSGTFFKDRDMDTFMKVSTSEESTAWAEQLKWVGDEGAIFVFVDGQRRVVCSFWAPLPLHVLE